MNIKTIVIQSNQQPDSDDSLTRLLEIHNDQETDQSTTMWFGIENESGQIYRLVGVDGVADYVKTLKRLSAAGYWVQSMEADGSSALHAVVKSHGDIQSM